MLWPSDHLCGSLLDSFQQVHVFFILGSPWAGCCTPGEGSSEGSRAAESPPLSSWPGSFGCSQDVVGLQAHILGHIEFLVNQCFQVLSSGLLSIHSPCSLTFCFRSCPALIQLQDRITKSQSRSNWKGPQWVMWPNLCSSMAIPEHMAQDGVQTLPEPPVKGTPQPLWASLHLALLNLMAFPWAHLSSLSWSLRIASPPSSMTPTSHSWCHRQHLWGALSISLNLKSCFSSNFGSTTKNKYLALFRSLLTLAKLLLMSQKWHLYEKNEISLNSCGVFISKFVGRYPLLEMTGKKTDCSHSLSKWQPGRSATEANLSSH